MDWNDKFASIVRETENNLDRVKHRLKSAKSTALTSLSSPVYSSTPHSINTQRKVTFDHSVTRFGGDSHDMLYNGDDKSTSNIDQSSSVSSVLYEQIIQQNKIINELKREVGRLSMAREEDQRQLKQVSAELTQVHNRLVEHSVDIHTEHKMEQWKRDILTELRDVHGEIQSYKTLNDGQQYSSSQLQSVMKEIQDIKRFIMDENQSVRREIDRWKTKLVKLETDVTSLRTDVHEVNRRFDKVDRTVQAVSESQRSHDNHMTRNNDDRENDKLQLQEIKYTVRGLREKMSSLECDVFNTVQTESKSKTGGYKERNKRKTKRDKNPKTANHHLSGSTSSGLSTLSMGEYSSDVISLTPTKHTDTDLNLDDLDDLDLSDVPSLSASDLEL